MSIDLRIRELEREKATGDPRAAEKLEALLIRTGLKKEARAKLGDLLKKERIKKHKILSEYRSLLGQFQELFNDYQALGERCDNLSHKLEKLDANWEEFCRRVENRLNNKLDKLDPITHEELRDKLAERIHWVSILNSLRGDPWGYPLSLDEIEELLEYNGFSYLEEIEERIPDRLSN